MEASAQSFIDNYNLLECIQCGVCTGSCPVSMKSELNIRRTMRDIVFTRKVDIPPDDTLWSCTTCSACETRCPKGLIPVDVVLGMRETVVEEGRIAPTIRDALESVFKHGNPWGRIRSKRSEWAEGLNVKPFSEEVGWLYFVGCTPAYDPRCQELAKALARTFDTAGVIFGTLGNDESCCGSPVYGMGEKGLFELLVEDNKELFDNHDVERIVTTSPHCYNAFTNRYGKTSLETKHYTQLIADLIDSGKLSFTKGVDKTITFQDPCFLGRQNNIYDEPRKILESIPETEFIDLDRSRERSLCCEGGGGRMWIDVPGERLAERRIRDAVEMGADIIATTCPFCLSTLEDAVLTSDHEGSIEVLDIIELVSQAL